MSATQLRGNTQVQDQSISISKLMENFLSGVNWDITNGANNAVITGLGSPSSANDATNKDYVDALIQGLKKKSVARVKAQANVASLTGTQTIDGVALVDGDQILLMDQTTTTEDGLYIVRSDAWERSSEWSVGVGVSAYYVFVSEGTDDNNGYVVTNDPGDDVIGTDDIVMVQFSAAGIISAANGLSKVGNSIELGGTLTKVTTVSTTGTNTLTVDGDGAKTISGNGEITTNSGTADNNILGNNVILNAINDLSFSDSEVIAEAGDDIPLAMTTTIDHGNGTDTGDIITDFREAFTDNAIINALVELKMNVNSINKLTRYYNETPTVTNGQAAIAALSNLGTHATDKVTNVVVALNGIMQNPGASNDYQLNALTGVITFNSTLATGDVVICSYDSQNA